jgi:hypothetical protein
MIFTLHSCKRTSRVCPSGLARQLLAEVVNSEIACRRAPCLASPFAFPSGERTQRGMKTKKEVCPKNRKNRRALLMLVAALIFDLGVSLSGGPLILY